MDLREFYENINTWLTIYNDITKPDMDNDEFIKKWNKGMMKVIAKIYVPDELLTSQVIKHLKKAIEVAQSGDLNKLDEIKVYLTEVELYLKDKIETI